MVVRAYDTTMSETVSQELRRYLVGGVASSFHSPAYADYPIVMTRGDGTRLYDVDGNRYIDYVMGFGSMILGHHDPDVDKAARAQLEYGTHFSAPTPSLYRLAKRLTEIIPCARRVTFHNSGTEAVMQALRVARAATGKWKIIKFEGQYHGWSDEEKVTIDANDVAELGDRTHPNKILPTRGQRPTSADDLIILPWNDAALLKETLQDRDDVAAVIMEPFMCDSGPIPPKPGYLQQVREITREHRVLLIFDEVITGFRLALGGAQEYFGVTPDLATFAKAIANGFPFACLCGRADIMECGVPASGTFNGNPLGVAAASATIRKLEETDAYASMERHGEALCAGILEVAATHGVKISTNHYGGLVTLHFGVDHDPTDFRDWLTDVDHSLYSRFVRECERRGVRLTDRRGREYLCAAYGMADVDRTLEVFDAALPIAQRESL